MLDYKVLLILRSRYMVGHGLFMQMYACTFWPFQHKNKEYNKKFTFSLLFGHFPFIIIHQVHYYEDETTPTGTCAVCIVGDDR